MNKYTAAGLAIIGILYLFSTGCSIAGAPRPRPGCYAANTMGVTFRNADSLGGHNFGTSLGECTGIVYTCNGGHIDLAHLRIGSDHVFYLYNYCRKRLASGQKDWHFNLAYDPTKFHAVIAYPAGFDSMPTALREKLIDDVSLELARYFAWYLTTWHEVITWNGYGSFVVSEFHSAFAWEDSYSNLLGVILGARAAASAGSSTSAYNSAMTSLLEDELVRLGAVPASQARTASESMNGRWYSGSIAVQMLLRNLDVGGSDGCVSPAIVPGACQNATPECLPVPRLRKFNEAGFALRLEASPPGGIGSKIKRLIYKGGGTGPILADEHLPLVMNHIASEARKKGYSVIE